MVSSMGSFGKSPLTLKHQSHHEKRFSQGQWIDPYLNDQLLNCQMPFVRCWRHNVTFKISWGFLLAHAHTIYEQYEGAHDEVVKFVTNDEDSDKTTGNLFVLFLIIVEERCFKEFYVSTWKYADKIQFNGHAPLK